MPSPCGAVARRTGMQPTSPFSSLQRREKSTHANERTKAVILLTNSQNGEFHFAYFDLRDRIGSAVEVVQYDRQAYEMIENLKGPRD